ILEVLRDGRRFGKREVVVHERGYAVGERRLREDRRVVFAGSQVDPEDVERQSFFMQSDKHRHGVRTDVLRIDVEQKFRFHHCSLPWTAWLAFAAEDATSF